MSDILDRLKIDCAVRKEELLDVLRALLARIEAVESAVAAKSADYNVLRGTVSYEPRN